MIDARIGRMGRRAFTALAMVAIALGLGNAPARAADQEVLVFAAASLTNALGDIATEWEKAGHPKPRLAFAASSTLARQIEAGAPADVFASADATWMDHLERRSPDHLGGVADQPVDSVQEAEQRPLCLHLRHVLAARQERLEHARAA